MANRYSRIADQLGERLGVSLDHFLDVADLLLRLRIEGLIRGFQTVPASALLDVDARWDATDRVITIRREVYDRAVAGNPHDLITDAMRRERNLKHWPRRWKIELIEAMNPSWDDLYPRLVG